LIEADPAFTDSVDIAEPPDGGVTEVGDNVQVAPVGHPETLRSTAELKPFNDPTVIVEVPELPCWIVREPGDADKEKSGVGGGGGDPPAAWNARRASTLPFPYTVFGTAPVGQLGLVLWVQAVLKRMLLTCVGDKPRFTLSINAMVPDTCGVAIDVPLIVVYPSLR